MRPAPYQIYKAKTVNTATVDGIKILRDEIKWDNDLATVFQQALFALTTH